jgi:hypothetical protein
LGWGIGFGLLMGGASADLTAQELSVMGGGAALANFQEKSYSCQIDYRQYVLPQAAGFASTAERLKRMPARLSSAWVAVLARAAVFGFRLGAYDPYVNEAAFAAAGVRRLDAAELFGEAGVLSLHLPYGEKTRHFLNRETLAKMRRDAIIVNTPSGGLIDTVAQKPRVPHP